MVFSSWYDSSQSSQLISGTTDGTIYDFVKAAVRSWVWAHCVFVFSVRYRHVASMIVMLKLQLSTVSWSCSRLNIGYIQYINIHIYMCLYKKPTSTTLSYQHPYTNTCIYIYLYIYIHTYINLYTYKCISTYLHLVNPNGYMYK